MVRKMKILPLKSIVISLIFVSSAYSYNHLLFQEQQPRDSLTITDPMIHVPRILYKPNIELPQGVRLDSGKVTVFVKATIDTLGKVHSVKVLKSDNRAYNKKALQLAKRYIFESGTVDGKSRPLVISWPIEFMPAKTK